MVTTSDTLSGAGTNGRTAAERPGVDLTTSYLGLSLRNPIVASPSPATSTVERVKALADAGVGAVVLPSLYEEQVIAEELREIGFTEPYEDVHGEAQGYFPVLPGTQLPGATWRYLNLVREAVAAVDVPVIASLNGSSIGGWTDFAVRMEAAGAAALELNIYFVPGDPRTSRGAPSRTGTSRSSARSRTLSRSRSR
jgi:dihydroorotate dehydrogenase (fumarate)